jgi:hypothetical protein
MTLYKYRNWVEDYNKDVLRKNELFLAPPSMFNDPFDCQIFANFVNLSSEELEKYALRLIKQASLSDNEKDFIINKIAKDPLTHQRSYEEIAIKSYDKFLGVLSLSANWNNVLMWSHYAAFHTGYCIGLNKDKLSSIQNFGAEGFVDYPEDNRFPSINPIEDGNVESYEKAVYNKSIDWNYEQEYRFTKIIQPDGFKEKDRVIKFDNNCIDEVIIGMNADSNTQKEIINICADKNIPVYKAERVPFKFLITKTLLEK